MTELLDLTRREYEAATRYMDEEAAQFVEVDLDVRLSAFDEFMKLHNFIQQTQMDIKDRCIVIGFALLEIKRQKLYNYVAPKDKGGCGYSSFKKFCKDVFGFPKSTSTKLVRVAEQFCAPDGSVKLEFKRYSYSQLAEMLRIEPAHRIRINAKCSVRDIRHLGDLYKTYPPKEGTSVEADLERWREIRAKEQAEKNAKKDSLSFIPARKSDEGSTSNPDEISGDEDEFDGEDSRDLFTPDVEQQHISFEAIRNGLLRQLQLLRNCDVGVAWKKCADIFEDALNANAPRKVASSKDVVNANVEIARLKDEVTALKAQPSAIVREGMALPPAQKLTLKNAKERKEWLEGYEAWPVWLDVPEVSKTFYRYDFINGAALIVEVGSQYYDAYSAGSKMGKKEYSFVRYCILDETTPKYDCGCAGGTSAIVDWLTKHAKEI